MQQLKRYLRLMLKFMPDRVISVVKSQLTPAASLMKLSFMKAKEVVFSPLTALQISSCGAVS